MSVSLGLSKPAVWGAAALLASLWGVHGGERVRAAQQAIVRQAAGPVIWHAWRRDGRVVYATRHPDAIWTADGAASRCLSRFTRKRCLPVLSSDGKAVAFPMGSSVGLVNLETDRRARVRAGGEVRSLAWRPVGGQLAFSVGSAIYLVAADGSNRRLLRHVRGYRKEAVEAEYQRWWPCSRVDGLRWSANGRVLGYLAWARISCAGTRASGSDPWLSPRLVLMDVARRRTAHYVDGYGEADSVFALSPDGRHWTMSGNWGDDAPRLLVDGDQVASGGAGTSWPSVAWSPAAGLVAWERRERSPQPAGTWETRETQLVLLPTAARGSGRGTPDGFREFEWSPDGEAFVYHRRQFGSWSAGPVHEDASGARPRLITSELRLVSVSDVLKAEPDSSPSGRPFWRVPWRSLRYGVLVRSFRGTDPAWSPDGRKVSWIEGREIRSISACLATPAAAPRAGNATAGVSRRPATAPEGQRAGRSLAARGGRGRPRCPARATGRLPARKNAERLLRRTLEQEGRPPWGRLDLTIGRIAAGNFDSDKAAEYVVGFSCLQEFAPEASGKVGAAILEKRGAKLALKWHYARHARYGSLDDLQVVDFDHDGIREFLVSSQSMAGGATVYGEAALFRWQEGAYQEVWRAETAKDSRHSEPQGEEFFPAIRFRDVDRDGIREIVVAGTRKWYRFDHGVMRPLREVKEQRVYEWDGRRFKLHQVFMHPFPERLHIRRQRSTR